MLLGLLYERYGTYDMREYGGLAAKLPWMVTLFVITTLSIIGLPMLNSFVGEFLILSGSMQSTFAHHHLWTALATIGFGILPGTPNVGARDDELAFQGPEFVHALHIENDDIALRLYFYHEEGLLGN